MSINVQPDPAQSPASMHQGSARTDNGPATGTDGTPAARTPDRLHVLTGEGHAPEWQQVASVTRQPAEFDDLD